MLLPRRLLNIRPDAFNNSCTETCQVKQEARIPGRLRFLMRGSHGLASRPISCFASLQRVARLMRTLTPACASSAKGRMMTLIGSCSALTPRHTPPLISCAVSLPSIAHSYSASLFHTVSQTVSHRGPVHLGWPPPGLIRVTAGRTAPIAACCLFFFIYFFYL